MNNSGLLYHIFACKSIGIHIYWSSNKKTDAQHARYCALALIVPLFPNMQTWKEYKQALRQPIPARRALINRFIQFFICPFCFTFLFPVHLFQSHIFLSPFVLLFILHLLSIYFRPTTLFFSPFLLLFLFASYINSFQQYGHIVSLPFRFFIGFVLPYITKYAAGRENVTKIFYFL